METYNEWLAHHGIPGMKWGKRNGPPYPLSGNNASYYSKNNRPYSKNDSVFISGKVKYDRPLNEIIRRELDDIMHAKCKILIGDAPGADTRCQEYLALKKYGDVVVYTTDDKVRNNAGNWPVKRISSDGYSDEASIRRQKDIAMTNNCTRAFAITLEEDRPDSAMSNNINRLVDGDKYVKVFDYNKNSWIEPKNKRS